MSLWIAILGVIALGIVSALAYTAIKNWSTFEDFLD